MLRESIWSWLVARLPWLTVPKASLTLEELVEGEPELWHLVRSMLEAPLFRDMPETELAGHIQTVAGASLRHPLCGKELRDQLARVCRDPTGGIDTLKVRNHIFALVNLA